MSKTVKLTINNKRKNGATDEAVVNFIKEQNNKISLEAVTEVAIGVTDDLVDKIFTDVMSEVDCKNGDTSMEEQEEIQKIKEELATLVAKITHENL
jgi:hypothetical protein